MTRPERTLCLRNIEARGKTEGVRKESEELDSDVEFVLDADTILESENYIERVVEELYRLPGVATACGRIHPLRDVDRLKLAEDPSFRRLFRAKPGVTFMPKKNGWHALSRKLTNLYRDTLYYFVQNVIYRGNQELFGSIPNPVGCAVAYRREYLKETIHEAVMEHGDNLTSSEDIFFGLAFIYHGYRNIQVTDVVVRSEEPEAQVVPKQLLLWSSAWLQSVYYLPKLLASPFLTIKRYVKHKLEDNEQKLDEDAGANRRKIKDPYRWPWGEAHTNQVGRSYGWAVSLAIFEKTSFPLVLILMILMQWWEALIVTVVAEVFIFSTFIMLFGKEQRFLYFLKGLITAPLRYASILFDLIVVTRFVYDISIGGRTEWRK